jgi:hypothetical protein
MNTNMSHQVAGFEAALITELNRLGVFVKSAERL